MTARLAAQTSSGPASGDTSGKAIQLEKLVVTGSNIPTAADSSDAPVVIIGHKDIEQTGLNANLLEVLRKSIPAFAGRSNTGNSNATTTNQNTGGGSSIALRNLDTLILINGRRVAMSGTNGLNGGKNFVDINMIPVAAVERIEVLTDGASAIYGSDAIGGVINVILKNNYEGSEIGGRYAFTTNTGHYVERSGYVTAGAAVGQASLTASVSWSKTDPLFENQRAFIANNLKTGTAFPGFAGGNFLDPSLSTPSTKNPVGAAATATSYADLVANGTYIAAGSSNIPLFNASPYVTLLMASEQKSGVVAGSFEIIPKKLVAFADVLISRTKSDYQTSNFLSTAKSNITVPAGAPFNPLTVAATGVTIAYLDHPLSTHNEGKGDRFTGGFRGEINDHWSWEVGATYSKQTVTQHLENNLFSPTVGGVANYNLINAIAGGYNSAGVATPGGTFSQVVDMSLYPTTVKFVIQPALDPFARRGANPASLANLFGTQTVEGISKLLSLDAKVVGSVFDLPAGRVGVAAGLATRKERIQGIPDKDSYTLANFPSNKNWAAGLAFDPFKKGRAVDSYFAEVRIPVFGDKFTVAGGHALELSAAQRGEKYTDVGNSSVPKFGVRWQPLDEQLTVRFTYSKAFAAPDLAHEYAPAGATLTTSTLFTANLPADPRLLPTYTFFSGNGNNPGLKPSQAWTRNIGFTFSPKKLKDFSISLDYGNLFYKGLPAGSGGNNIVRDVNANGSASIYFGSIAVGGLAGQPGSSQALLATPGGLLNYLVSGNYNNDIYITDRFINSGGIHVKTYDFRVEYRHRTTDMGIWTFSTNGTYLQSYQFQTLPANPFFEFAGYSTNGQTIAGSMPKWSFRTTIDWTMKSWEVVLADTYSTGMTDIGTTPPATFLVGKTPTGISPYQALDFQTSYTFDKAAAGQMWSLLRGLKLTVGLNNLMNRMPPAALLSQNPLNNNPGADVAQFSPIGRLFFFSGSVKF